MKRILVIEDEASIRNNLLLLLKSEGYDAFGAGDGKSGISAAKKNPPDLVLCDLMMPEIDGYGVLTALREDPETGLMPFIFLTARTDHQDIRKGMNLGADDYLTKPFSRDDLLNAVQSRLARSGQVVATKLPEVVDRSSAMDDFVDALPNRSRLMEFFVAMSAQSGRLLLLGVSIDHFGDIAAGLSSTSLDALLRQVSSRLEEISKRHHGVAVRAMGETFLLLIQGESSGAAVVSKEVLGEMRQPFFVGGTRLHLSASVGAACYPEHSNELEPLVGSAQGAISKARASGGDTWHLHNPEIEILPHNRLDLSSSLFGAVEAGELFLVYQPQVSLKNGEITGFEALIRWNRGDAGVVSPAVFIPLAEENGAILEIGEWVVKTAAAQVKIWIESDLPPVKMSVNISPRQLRSDGLAEMIQRVIHESGVPAECLGFEVTESALVHDIETCKKVLQDIRDTGAGVSMDDFGTGYCGLGYLGRLPFDTLKIDRSFVSGLPDAPDKLAIVPALLQMARGLGLRTIAEGVETVDELRFLHTAGCDQMQGYLFSRPISAAECTQLLENRVGMNLAGMLSAAL